MAALIPQGIRAVSVAEADFKKKGSAMTNRGMAVLGVRLLALYFLVHHLSALPLMLTSKAESSWLSSLAMLIPLLAVALLWFFAGSLASLILPRRTAAPQASAPANSSDWYGVAFAAVGLLITLNSLPELLRIALEIYWQRQELQGISPTQIVAVAAALLQFLLGLLALLGRRGLSRAIVSLRATSTSSTPSLE